MKKVSVFILALAFLLAGTLNTHQAQAQAWICKGKTGCTTIGNVCPDGTIFAGCVESNVPIYTSRCDIGYTWNGATCAGGASTFAWNNGNAANYTTTGATSLTNGMTNTATLLSTDSDSSTGGVQPHQAAAACNSYLFQGYSDWYLPAQYEAWVLGANNAAIGNFASLAYWSSTQLSSSLVNFLNLGSPVRSIGYNPKQMSYRVRCVRRD
jgi:hypothetical protein